MCRVKSKGTTNQRPVLTRILALTISNDLHCAKKQVFSIASSSLLIIWMSTNRKLHFFGLIILLLNVVEVIGTSMQSS